MGRTNPTYRDIVQQERGDWRRMRQYLRKHKQPSFDRLWEHAEGFSDAAGEANRRNPTEAILMSICLGQQIEITALEDRVAELDDRIE